MVTGQRLVFGSAFLRTQFIDTLFQFGKIGNKGLGINLLDIQLLRHFRLS